MHACRTRGAALRRKVSVTGDASFVTTAAAVAITTADGAVHNLTQAAARGSDANPMSDRDWKTNCATPRKAGIRATTSRR